jgi:hypothetical protein
VKRTAVLVGFALAGMLSMPHADATWQATTVAGSASTSAGLTLAAGSTPVATAPSGSTSVTVSWAPQAVGAPANGFEIRAYDATSSAPRSITGGCTGLVMATSCVESTAPNGTWRYTVTARQQLWSGAESPRSNALVVGP